MATFEENKTILLDYAKANYKKMLREPQGKLAHKFIVPGACYDDNLWDWDSWLTNIALRGINGIDFYELAEYEKGCILNFVENRASKGRLYICITPTFYLPSIEENSDVNIHKPCLCQHALFVCRNVADFSWLKNSFNVFEEFIDYYFNYQYHRESGLFVWIDDCAIGVDNDPATFYRPKRSSASIYLNCLMYKELLALSEIAENLGFKDKQQLYKTRAEELCEAIRKNLWDERDGFYYSGDVNLLPVDPNSWLHQGAPRNWNVLIQRIDVWSGFLAMWAGIATKEQADKMVQRYRDNRTFGAAFGVRTLGKCEKMYQIVKTGNPSCWLGPIWGVSNYLTYEGFRSYGFTEDANDLAIKTLSLFGNDLRVNGLLHEYYDPDTGMPVNNPGFQNWNLCSLLMEIE